MMFRARRVDESSGYLWLSALLFASLVSITSAKSNLNGEQQGPPTAHFQPVIAGCKVNCTGVRLRRVCGSDGITYQSKCHAKQVRKCQGQDVQVKASGSCRDPPSGPPSKCHQERLTALERLLRSTEADGYVPECTANGAYASAQCHTATGYCWCVSPEGKPYSGSTVLGRSRIRCRSPRRPSLSSTASESRQDVSKTVSRNDRSSHRENSCSGSDRSTFNSNLLVLFSEEYARFPKPSPPSYAGAPKELPIVSESDALLDTEDKRVIAWKFSELDSDKDDSLRSHEVRDLRELVKKLVRPKSCARDFLQYCDLDDDERIERNEWSVCLGVDLHSSDDHPVEQDGASKQRRNKKRRKKKTRPLNPGKGNLPDPGSTSHDSFLSLSVNQGVRDEEEVVKDNPELSDVPLVERPSEATVGKDCLSEQTKAKEMDRRDPESGIFIPECVPTEEGGPTGGGRVLYRREQCHKATKYCWCVDQETGVPIPGLSTHNVMPECDNIKAKVFKGCPYPQKKHFLQELLDQLSTQMVEHAANVSAGSKIFEPNPEHSLEERAARWKLAVMDSNNNQVLERKELKDFKKEIKRTLLLRKCGRNFVKYCDDDADHRITIDEWIECLGLNEEDQQSTLPVNPKRQGPNPFKKFLRDS